VTEPVFLELEEVLQIHSRSLDEHGGMEGTRDPGLVDKEEADEVRFGRHFPQRRRTRLTER